MTLEDSLCELDSLLTSSLAKHLRADVPYGVFLSGGIDSSLIAAYAKKVLGEKELNTFTVKVGFADLDESEVARSVANWAGVKNKSFLLTESEVLSSIDDVLTHIDEPLADPGLINCSFICHQAKKHITVALAGDGGDELFGGYLSFKAISWHQQLSYLPDNLVRSLVWLMGRFLYANTGYMSKGFKLKQFIKGHFTTDAQRLPRWLSSFDLLELKNLYTKDISTKNNPENLFLEAIACAEKLNQKALGNIMLYQYQKYFLPEFVLGHTDRASMQTALEVRCPLIDKNLIEFANRLPFEFKVKNGQLKVELFKLLEQLNAPQVLLNHPKKGFTFPVADWMKGRLRPMLRDILSPQAVADIGLFNPTYVEKLISDHEAGRANNYRQLWNLLVLFCWKKNYPNVSFNG
jgi:asparagine synthase (glutamine-hydrolysing)